MLSQVVSLLVSPLGVAVVLSLLSLMLSLLVALHAGRRGQTPVAAQTLAPWRTTLAWWLGALALAWLWVWSTPLASEALRGHLENQAGPRLLEDVVPAQAIVVLGGATRGPVPPHRHYPDLTGAADRLWHAARLYHAGKAPNLLLVGGPVATGGSTEAEAMQQFLADMGVPASAMALENRSHNTATNALYAAQMLRAQNRQSVILVTSALHMPRALRWFAREGLTVGPAPTDFEVVPRPMGLRRLLPDTEALHGSARAFKELVARWAQP